MSPPPTASTRRRSERHALVVLLGGARVGNIYQSAPGTLRFVYLEEWRKSKRAYPLSLSMPLTAQEHRHEAITHSCGVFFRTMIERWITTAGSSACRPVVARRENPASRPLHGAQRCRVADADMVRVHCHVRLQRYPSPRVRRWQQERA